VGGTAVGGGGVAVAVGGAAVGFVGPAVADETGVGVGELVWGGVSLVAVAKTGMASVVAGTAVAAEVGRPAMGVGRLGSAARRQAASAMTSRIKNNTDRPLRGMVNLLRSIATVFLRAMAFVPESRSHDEVYE